jgi:hypothetical protein
VFISIRRTQLLAYVYRLYRTVLMITHAGVYICVDRSSSGGSRNGTHTRAVSTRTQRINPYRRQSHNVRSLTRCSRSTRGCQALHKSHRRELYTAPSSHSRLHSHHAILQQSTTNVLLAPQVCFQRRMAALPKNNEI